MNIGIVGGGQLAKMLALAGHPLGLRFTFLDPSPEACAAPLGVHLRGDYDDPEMLRALAAASDLVTYEFENVPEAAVSFLGYRAAVYPSAEALSIARDRLREKSLFRRLGLATAEFRPIGSLEDLRHAASEIGLPAVLKTRTMGYDGKGQIVLRTMDDLPPAWARLGDRPLLLESLVDFDRELSIVAVRNRSGRIGFYPVSENVHVEGVLRTARCMPGDAAQAEAERYAYALLESLDYVGVLALEMFQVGDTLIINEMAPRVHNSGHWTIEGAGVSQFENHLRAILDLPLGATGPLGHTAMVNFIGSVPKRQDVLAVPGVHFHDYGKSPRPDRKLGHATVLAENAAALDAALDGLRLLSGASAQSRETRAFAAG